MNRITACFKNATVLVTGANGFIGSHLTRRLVTLGAKPVVFVGATTPLWRLKDVEKRIKIYRVNMANFKDVKIFVRKIRPLKIYHLAAQVDVSRSFELVNKMIDINLKGTINILSALIESKCSFDSFVNTGTCEEYGDGRAPFLEIQRENPVSAYSSSKVSATYFCQMLYKTQKIPIVTIRPFLTYGPYQTNNMLIPSLIRKCLLKKEFEMTKGEQTRDFNYVSDIVEGYIKASITQGAIGEIINLGSGREYKIKDVVNLIVRMTKTRIKPKVGKLPYREGETMHFYCSNIKAKKILHWQPIISLEEGLSRTIKWYSGHLYKTARDIYDG